MKFAGPKAWAEVPNEVKDLAFRKPFSKKLKEHILNTIFTEMTPQRNIEIENNEIAISDIAALFEAEDGESEFFGFLNTSVSNDLAQIFDESNTSDFLGF